MQVRPEKEGISISQRVNERSELTRVVDIQRWRPEKEEVDVIG